MNTAEMSQDVAAFLASLTYYLEPEDAKITTDEAAYTLSQWAEEGVDIPEALTPEILAGYYREYAPRENDSPCEF